jgi:F-type H+-transporting ATPase subunit epsilon
MPAFCIPRFFAIFRFVPVAAGAERREHPVAYPLLLEIVTPVRLVFGRPVESVSLRGIEGEFCVLPLHMPLLTALPVGSLSYRRDGQRHYAYVGGGFVEVTRDRVLVLAETAELPEEIDIARAMRAGERARARLESLRQEEFDYRRAHASLHRAISRIKVHQNAGLGDLRAAGGIAR